VIDGAPVTDESRIFRPGLLDGRVAIVSGGGSGLGRAIALELNRLGARVTICGRRPEPLGETAALATRGRIATAACDVREEAQVTALVEGVLEHQGRIDLLVNNAGGQFLAPAEQITAKGFRTVIRLNLESAWLMSHAVATIAMIPGQPPQGGKIVNITLSPHHGLPGMAHSAASRAAVENLTRTLSIEWARFGVRINAIAVGQIATDTLLTKYPQPFVDAIAGSIPLGRMGEADDIAWLVAYLASPAGDFISGAVLTVDGARDNWLGGWPPQGLADESGAPLSEERRRRR
jgi:citronellol/citronellal dehydrogenase